MNTAPLKAYRRTTFTADTPKGRLRLRVSQHCPELDALLAGHEVATWAYVTAFNPGSEPLTVEENTARQRRLERSVAKLGLVSYPGEGIGDDRRWPPEPSLLILGIGREKAKRLGRELGQIAILYGEARGGVELLECKKDAGPIVLGERGGGVAQVRRRPGARRRDTH